MALNIDFHPDPYREIRNRALSARISLDTPARPDLRHSDKLADHISYCLINPTRGLIASRDYLNAENVNYPKYYGRNLHLMKKLDVIKYLIAKLDERINEFYPKTKKYRDFVINTDRIKFDFTEPVKHDFRRAIFKIFGR